jgi:hypothetical protein
LRKLPGTAGEAARVGFCALALIVGGATMVQASETLTYEGGYFSGGDSGLAGYDDASIANSYTGNPYSDPITGEVAAGADSFAVNAGTPSQTMLAAYCVDVGHYLTTSGAVTYNVFADTDPTTISYFGTLSPNATPAEQTAAGTLIVQDLEHLASNWLGQVTNADSSAAFQIAVWDIAFNNGLTTSTFTSMANGSDAATVNSLVQMYLGNLSGPVSEQLTFLQDPLNVSQNMITFTPVPLPAAGWLLLSGLAGVVGFGWRRAQSRA